MAKKIRRPTPQSTKDVRSAVGCIIGALICVPFMKEMWLFFIIFVVCAVMRILMRKKHKEAEAKIADVMDKLDAYGDEEDEPTSLFGRLQNKMLYQDDEEDRQKRYSQFVSELEDQLGDFEDEDDEE